MTSTTQTSAPRRAIWRWVLLVAGICLAPFLLLGAIAVSYLTLDSDVRALRKQVMAATDASWHTKVQMDVGQVTLGAVNQGLRFVRHKDMADARLALSAVKHVSVGVYERTSERADCSSERLFVDTDRVMQRRGWTRLVGVADHKENVLIYARDRSGDNEPLDLCIAVVNGRELVVVSTSVDPSALGELVERHAGDGWKRQFRSSKLGL